MFPNAFVQDIKKRFGAEADAFLEALNEEPSVSVRLNDKASFGYAERVPWCDTGFYLPERPSFTADPLFHAGAYYVQEAASMFVEQAVKQHIKESVKMLDLCAAPGGKSTHLSSVLPEGSFLVSNEYVKTRANILSENMTKWGAPHVLVTNNKPADFARFGAFFDAMLVDAPCSGEGMFRKDETAVAEWSPENVRMCVARQREILSDVWPSLKQDGILIYSTCTFNEQENEENVRWISEELGAEILPLHVQPEWNIIQTAEGCHFYPYKTHGEGLFLSVLRKTAEEETLRIKPEKPQKMPKELTVLREWVERPDAFQFAVFGNHAKAVVADYADEISMLERHLRVLQSGITLAEQKGKDFIPDASLALSKSLNRSAFAVCDVDYETAIRFLQRDAIVVDAPRGFVLVIYKDVPLGWVKNLGNRSNNLYPQEWRIRMKMC